MGEHLSFGWDVAGSSPAWRPLTLPCRSTGRTTASEAAYLGSNPSEAAILDPVAEWTMRRPPKSYDAGSTPAGIPNFGASPDG